jgi:hypothetical protein
MTPKTARRILKWLLRVMGGAAMLAIVAVFMPTAWMEAGARWAGVGPFPDTTLTQYLARSVSALYALLGTLAVYISRDVRRYSDFIVFNGWLTVALGVILTVLDFGIGMPASWSWWEGPPTIAVGAAFVWLAPRVR